MPGRFLQKTWQSNPTIYAPPRHRRACKYDAFLPDALADLDPALAATTVAVVSEAESAIGRLNAEGGVALEPLARLLLRTESIASSKVEGLQVGVAELARAEAEIESGVTPSQTALELIANIDAMVLAVDRAAQAEHFAVEDITAIHHRMMERSPHKHIAGKIRTEQNWIGGNDYTPCGADFVPPPPEDVARLLADLCAAINDDRLSPLVQAALVHAQFETIHPFADGNGRTGRALVHVVLRRRGLAPRFLPPVSVVFARARDRYIDGLTSFRSTDVARWVELFAASTASATLLAEQYVAAVRGLQQSWRDQLTASGHAPRAGAAAWALIDVLPAHPMISGPVAIAATGRARAPVYEGIEQLLAAGVLLPLSQAKRNRWWSARGLLDLITWMESGEPPEAS
jgi:Fic family protein